MNISEEVGNQLAEFLQQKHGFATITQLDKSVSDLLKRAEKRAASGPTFSLSTMVRGLKAQRGEVINESTKSTDLEYVKALSPGVTPGSYLVPQNQSTEVIALLALGSVVRSAGARIWDMPGMQRLDVPTATTSPTWAWVGTNTSTTSTDANLGQLAFDLKERRALTTIPNALLRASVPAFDTLLSEVLSQSAGEHEDTALFSTTSVTNGPVSLYAAANTTTLLVGGSANGGNIAFTDITATLAKSAAAKARGPFVWFMSPRSWYSRILGMVDTTSRPLVIPTLTQGLLQGVPGQGQPAAGMLMGWPVFVSPAIPENQTNGSGSSQSYAVFTNPQYIHIAQSGGLEIGISTERAFEYNQTMIRAVTMADFGVAPPAGLVILQGVN
jgi:HK97 family phage major capsid protein